jgi:glycosyltransferase involved in cell wall biosynthesis
MRILFLSRWYPYPPDNGSRLRIYNLIRQLSRQHQIDLISYTEKPVNEWQMSAMQEFCTDIRTIDYKPFQPNQFKSLLGYFSPLPRSVIATSNPEFLSCVVQAYRETAYNVVIATQVDMAPYGMLELQNSNKILEEVELCTLYEQIKTAKNPLDWIRSLIMWQKWAHYIARLYKAYDGFTVVSEIEKKLVEKVTRKKITSPDAHATQKLIVLPNGVDLSQYSFLDAGAQPGKMIYAGSVTYGANYDAVDYFLKEIMPLIQAQYHAANLVVTGKTNGALLDRLPLNESVIFTGYLQDVRPAIASAWVQVVPLRVGGGTRLKILESLAIGTPVVSTSKGAEGLDLIPGQDILIADTPNEFANALINLFYQPELRHRLSLNGRKAIERKYDWDRIGEHLRSFIEQVVKSHNIRGKYGY